MKPAGQPRGRVIGLLIAATAHAHGARPYTRNAGDFAGLDDLIDVVGVSHALGAEQAAKGRTRGDLDGLSERASRRPR